MWLTLNGALSCSHRLLPRSYSPKQHWPRRGCTTSHPALLLRRKWGWGRRGWRACQHSAGLRVKQWKTRTHRYIASATPASKSPVVRHLSRISHHTQLTHASLYGAHSTDTEQKALTSTHCFLVLSTDPERSGQKQTTHSNPSSLFLYDGYVGCILNTASLKRYLFVESCSRIRLLPVPGDPTQMLQEQDAFTLMQAEVGGQHHNYRMSTGWNFIYRIKPRKAVIFVQTLQVHVSPYSILCAPECD